MSACRAQSTNSFRYLKRFDNLIPHSTINIYCVSMSRQRAMRWVSGEVHDCDDFVSTLFGVGSGGGCWGGERYAHTHSPLDRDFWAIIDCVYWRAARRNVGINSINSVLRLEGDDVRWGWCQFV